MPSASASAADLLIASMNAQRDRAVAEAAQRGADERRIEAARRAVEADRRKPKYYVVKRGDALGGIATMWNTTTDRCATGISSPATEFASDSRCSFARGSEAHA